MEAVDAFFVLWRDRLVESDFRAGSPIVAVAETNEDAPQLARSAAGVVTRRQEALAALFVPD
ncbi:LmrA/YxaF family transcription factor [Streptomyces finlayi]|uniref:LmrA/YxaF family transcription factor n=1 Tax=Streptomyces finlayi TaxID=67296 RepID=UPI0021566143|nr:hypothetical protein [Streptomyces finlayi]